jgi:hypothetical protein
MLDLRTNRYYYACSIRPRDMGKGLLYRVPPPRPNIIIISGGCFDLEENFVGTHLRFRDICIFQYFRASICAK